MSSDIRADEPMTAADLAARLQANADTFEAFREYFSITADHAAELADLVGGEHRPLFERFAQNLEHAVATFDEFAFGLVLTMRREAARLRTQ